MSDLEERLRTAIEDSVADIEPDFDVMEAVRRGHRRRVRRFAAVCAASVAVILVAVVLLAHRASARVIRRRGELACWRRVFPAEAGS